jgi:putative transposase
LNEDTPIVPFRQSETIVDPLTELAREGARRILAEALKAAADAFVVSIRREPRSRGLDGALLSSLPVPREQFWQA